MWPTHGQQQVIGQSGPQTMLYGYRLRLGFTIDAPLRSSHSAEVNAAAWHTQATQRAVPERHHVVLAAFAFLNLIRT